MAAGEGPTVTSLDAAELAEAVALSASVGWNQVEADWRVFLERGRVMAVHDEEGRLGATAATLPFGPELAWISMVIVRADRRGRGLATSLLERCVAEISASGRTAGLDATPAGRPVYVRLGFEDCLDLSRWRRPAVASPAAASPPAGVRILPIEAEHWPAIGRLDRRAFGADRRFLLAALAPRSIAFAAVAEERGRLRGFVLGRDGRTATHLGPLVADDEAVAVALARPALERLGSAVSIDVADRFSGFGRWLGESGFVVERPFTRMYRGRSEPWGDATLTVAIAGPELG